MATVKPCTNFNAEDDAKALRETLKKITITEEDKQTIIDISSSRSNAQRQKIRESYKLLYGKDLVANFRSKLKFNFKEVVVALFTKPRLYDVECLTDAIYGPGTNEKTLIEILVSRSKTEMEEINRIYSSVHDRSLQRDIEGDTSGYFRRLLVSLSTGLRNTTSQTSSMKAKEDAERLYNAGEKRMGTDEEIFIMIMGSQSFAQLKETFNTYYKQYDRSIKSVIKSEFSGSIMRGLLAIVNVTKDQPAFFAKGLYKSMKGLGTDDKRLIRIIVSRSEIDMQAIKCAFMFNYKKSLESFIRDDTSGSYKKILIALVEGNE